jgi:hypothetical protein
MLAPSPARLLHALIENHLPSRISHPAVKASMRLFYQISSEKDRRYYIAVDAQVPVQNTAVKPLQSSALPFQTIPSN